MTTQQVSESAVVELPDGWDERLLLSVLVQMHLVDSGVQAVDTEQTMSKSNVSSGDVRPCTLGSRTDD